MHLLVIVVVALIVLGPERLPGAMRQVGKAMGDVRRLSAGLQDQVQHAMTFDPTDPQSERVTADPDSAALSDDGPASAQQTVPPQQPSSSDAGETSTGGQGDR